MDDLEQSIPTIPSLKDKRDNFAAATGQSNHEVFAALIDYLRPKAVSMRKWKEEKTLRQMCETKGNFYHASFRQITLTSFFVLVRLHTGVSFGELALRLSVTQAAVLLKFTA